MQALVAGVTAACSDCAALGSRAAGLWVADKGGDVGLLVGRGAELLTKGPCSAVMAPNGNRDVLCVKPLPGQNPNFLMG